MSDLNFGPSCEELRTQKEQLETLCHWQQLELVRLEYELHKLELETMVAPDPRAVAISYIKNNLHEFYPASEAWQQIHDMIAGTIHFPTKQFYREVLHVLKTDDSVHGLTHSLQRDDAFHERDEKLQGARAAIRREFRNHDEHALSFAIDAAIDMPELTDYVRFMAIKFGYEESYKLMWRKPSGLAFWIRVVDGETGDSYRTLIYAETYKVAKRIARHLNPNRIIVSEGCHDTNLDASRQSA